MSNLDKHSLAPIGRDPVDAPVREMSAGGSCRDPFRGQVVGPAAFPQAVPHTRRQVLRVGQLRSDTMTGPPLKVRSVPPRYQYRDQCEDRSASLFGYWVAQ